MNNEERFKLLAFWETLFDHDEYTCISDTVFGTELGTKDFLGQFFCINPLVGSRADSNVVAYRNILVEFDTGTIEEQKQILTDSGMPYSTLVFSGSKSLHAIISVEIPFQSEEEYRTVARAIYAKLPTADKKVLNPSRFSRTPDAIRDNGVKQALLDVRGRIPNAMLLDWVGPLQPFRGPVMLPKELWGQRLLPARVHYFLKTGAETGTRNSRLFYNACEMFRAGFDEEEIVQMVTDSPLDLTDREIRICVRSARKASNAG